MKKSNIIGIWAFATASVLSIGIGYAAAKSENPVPNIQHVVATEASSTTTQSTQESTTESSVEPSAQIPQWYQDAEDTVSGFEERRQDAMNRNTTFNIGGVADEVRMAMEILEANEDEDSAAYDMQNILIFKGYDNEQMRVDLMNRASSLAEVSE